MLRVAARCREYDQSLEFRGRRPRQTVLVGGRGARRVAICALRVLVIGLLVGAGQAAATHAGNPQVPVGGFPTGITLDPLTDTIYVANGTTDTLSLIDGRDMQCRRCRRLSAGRATAITAGIDPIGSAVDESTRTLYVANCSGTLAVVNDHAATPPTVRGATPGRRRCRSGSNPQFLAVDEKTDTIYVANIGSNTDLGDRRRARCNARSSAGCGHPVRASIPAGPGPFALAVDDETHSIYVTDLRRRTVSMSTARTCNAADVSGCRRAAVSSTSGRRRAGSRSTTRTDTVYVTGRVLRRRRGDRRRDAATRRPTSGCRQTPLRIRAGAGARGIAVDEATDTVYVANTFADTVSVIDGATCNATVHSACGQQPTAAPVGPSPRRLAVDPRRRDTIYVTNAGSNTVTMLDGRTCNGNVHSGCGKVAPSQARGLPVA